MKLYKIRDWNRLFENNRSRTVENPRWVPIPNRHDGENYSALITSKDGAQIFAAFILMLEVASRCSERGALIRSNGTPHDAASLSQKTRAPKIWFDLCLDYLTKNTDWLEVVDMPDDAVGCQSPVSRVSVSCQPPDPSRARAGASIPSIPFSSEGDARGRENLPKTESEAVSMCMSAGVPDAFIKSLWDQAEARNWVDGSGQAIIKWPSYVKRRWNIEQSRKSEANANHSRSTTKPNPRLEGVSRNNAVNNYADYAAKRMAKANAELAAKVAANKNSPPPET